MTYNLTGAIIQYENGEFGHDQTIELYQHLVDSGLAWRLQGSYGRTAEALIHAGFITSRSKAVEEEYACLICGEADGTLHEDYREHDECVTQAWRERNEIRSAWLS